MKITKKKIALYVSGTLFALTFSAFLELKEFEAKIMQQQTVVPVIDSSGIDKMYYRDRLYQVTPINKKNEEKEPKHFFRMPER